ncbi:hypothetical protein [Streptomyces roseicoloratus]|uniref:Integral membrane protein n=1 Tax=Streptomyces roseicoloratus TaxID=2508722 RepID=A0ABY9S037_9ACTN|nr:hypothetical protein [Streptomyces roseicoloratus]WMX46455.1 hypothetical protein RGF97_18625 [Streptomyces roseicoloratus]
MLSLLALVGALAVIQRMRTVGVDGDGLGVLAVVLVFIPIVRRILGSRIVMEGSTITVVNPLVTYTIPVSFARYAATGRDGTLTIFLQEGDGIRSIGFAGSVLDGLIGSAALSVEKVDGRIRSRNKGKKGSQGKVLSKRVTVSPIADIVLLVALALGVAAVVIGN